MNNPRFIDPSDFDPSVKPADNFFQFVNGGWLTKNPIPREESRWGSFDILRVQAEQDIKLILEELLQKEEGALSPIEAKVKNFYASGMDREKRNAIGAAPLSAYFQKVDSIQEAGDLPSVVADLHRKGVHAFWVWSVEQDVKQSEVMAFYFNQGGLGLPDRDYYVNEDDRSKEIRKKYREYIAAMLARIPGISGAISIPEAVEKIVALETRLANVSMTRVELRDIEKQYHKMTLEELASQAPGVDWGSYCDALGAGTPSYVIVCQPNFMKEVGKIVREVPLEDSKLYLRWHIANVFASFLSEDFEKEKFEFYGKVFSGVAEMKPLWRRVLSVVNGMLDEAVGQLYVARHFSPEAKDRVSALVDHLMAAYRARIQNLSWMNAETKEKALAKLGKINKKLGYPEQWKEYSSLETLRDSYLENFVRAYVFEAERILKKIGKPVDRNEWYMSPQTVNACYSPTMNEILFPAAILQAPFFDLRADDAVNFGGIGTVIGHELTHGFADQGALFDDRGNLANWWLKEDKERFDALTASIAKQYDDVEVLPGLHVNGKLTLGENIADFGGLVIAFDGLLLALGEEGRADSRDGFTPLQRFFINYAITERGNIREEALRLRIQTDPHSPSICRVNVPLSNSTEFYSAFDCMEGDALYREPEQRVEIW